MAQYCFIFMYGTIVTLGLLANVAVLVAFASKKVPFLVIISFFARKKQCRQLKRNELLEVKEKSSRIAKALS